ncbi:MAG TPA: hypothetical protein VED59_05170 [Acidimicrobiales bacterium]|nr:hypothetical protein [Acidimicrobiales bacterium]
MACDDVDGTDGMGAVVAGEGMGAVVAGDGMGDVASGGSAEVVGAATASWGVIAAVFGLEVLRKKAVAPTATIMTIAPSPDRLSMALRFNFRT